MVSDRRKHEEMGVVRGETFLMGVGWFPTQMKLWLFIVSESLRLARLLFIDEKEKKHGCKQ